jgi:hypothetical protein
MRIKYHHVPHIARKIARDIANSDFVDIEKDIDSIAKVATQILDKDIEQEGALDEKVEEILEEQMSEIEFYGADYRQLFWLTKKKIAPDFGILTNLEERFSNVAHKILDQLWNEEYIDYGVSDTQVKNLIYVSIDKFSKGFEEADEAVREKMKNYKRKLFPGTEEFDLVYEKFYEEELIRRGLA